MNKRISTASVNDMPPCKYCGGEPVVYVMVGGGKTEYETRCEGCGTRVTAPEGASLAGAKAAWDKHMRE